MKKRLRGFSKKKISALVGIIAVAVVASASLIYLEVRENKDVAEATELLSDYQLKADAINKRLNSYFLPDRFLSEDVSVDKLTNEKELLAALTELENSSSFKKDDFKNYQASLETSKVSLEELTYKLEKQNALNDFFEEPVLNGSTVLNESIVKEESKESTLDLEDNTYKDKWSETVVQLYDVAKTQITAMTQAEEAVATLFSQGQVEESVTREEYDQVAKQVNELINPALKQTLTDQIKPVLELIAKNEDSAKKIAAEGEASAIGGTVEKQNDGSYLVIAPPEEIVKPEYTESVSQNDSTVQKEPSNNTSSSTSSKNSSNITTSSTKNSTKTESKTNQSQAASSESTTSPSKNNEAVAEWEGIDPLTGGNSSGGIYNNIDDIPGIETGNPPW